jgi:hypothetical protein
LLVGTDLALMRCCKAFVALSFLLLTAACGHVHPGGVAMAPNPSPPPGYRASCSSLPLPLNAFITACKATEGEAVAVVQAKG